MGSEGSKSSTVQATWQAARNRNNDSGCIIANYNWLYENDPNFRSKFSFEDRENLRNAIRTTQSRAMVKKLEGMLQDSDFGSFFSGLLGGGG